MMTTRDPDRTRQALLEAAFHEMYAVGFQAASLDKILGSAGVTKGALYHHFKGKTELGYAVVEEVIGSWIHEGWIQPLAQPGDPIELLKRTMESTHEKAVEAGVVQGCPLNNFAHEMAALDEGFRDRITTLFAAWKGAIANAFRRGQEQGLVRKDIDPEQVGTFVLAMIEGGTGLAKGAQSFDDLRAMMGMISLFLDGLRPGTDRAA